MTSDSENELFNDGQGNRYFSMFDRNRLILPANGNGSGRQTARSSRGGRQRVQPKVEKSEVEEEKEFAYVKRRVYLFKTLDLDAVNDLIK
jgi:hypothetical protein